MENEIKNMENNKLIDILISMTKAAYLEGKIHQIQNTNSDSDSELSIKKEFKDTETYKKLMKYIKNPKVSS